MAYEKIEIHKIDVNKRIQLLKDNFSKDSKSILLYLKDKILKNNISEKRQEKIITSFMTFLKHINKSFDEITKKDLEDYKTRILNNKVKQNNKKDYSYRSLQDYVDIARNYFKWKYPKKYKDWDLGEWFKIPNKKETVEVLTESEIEKLFDYCKTSKEKYLIAVLFDSGFRASEFLNIRFEDIIKPTQDFPYYKIDLKSEYSKTKGRIVGLFWKNTTKAIKNYLDEITIKNLKDRVFNDDYDNIRRFLARHGLRVLNKRIHFHMFRKSSCTYYASQLNRQQLCKRYGWTFSTDVVDVYISRSGLDENELKDKFLNSDLEKLQKENQELNTKIGLIKDSSDKEIEKIKQFLKSLIEGNRNDWIPIDDEVKELIN